MGTFSKQITLINRHCMSGVKQVTDFALVDTSADYLCINKKIANSLGISDFEELQTIDIHTAHDPNDPEKRGKSVPLVVGLILNYGGFQISVDAPILESDQILFGAIPMEMLNLIVDAKNGTLMPPPTSSQFKQICEPATKWIRRPKNTKS